jgi:hypothetical protein
MPPTGNTLAPSYNATPAEQKDMSPMRPEYFDAPEASAPTDRADALPQTVEPTIDQLEDHARSEAAAGWTVNRTAAATQENVIAPPIREGGIDTSPEMAYQEIAIDGPAVVLVRDAALRDANPEQRNMAPLN